MAKDWFKSVEDQAEGTHFSFEEFSSELLFDERGLIPVIVQDHLNNEILMFAWMNREAFIETINTGRMCYWSRSRKSLWRKGETSGHQQTLIELRADCDGDVLMAKVEQVGAACHTHRRSCFYFKLDQNGAVIRSS